MFLPALLLIILPLGLHVQGWVSREAGNRFLVEEEVGSGADMCLPLGLGGGGELVDRLVALGTLALLVEGAHLPEAEAGNAWLFGWVCDGGSWQDALLCWVEEVTDKSERVHLRLGWCWFGLDLLLLGGRVLDAHLPSQYFGLRAHLLLEAALVFGLFPCLCRHDCLVRGRVWAWLDEGSIVRDYSRYVKLWYSLL